MSELIISEKPDAAKKIASALADSAPKKESSAGVPFYRLVHKGRSIIVGCAVGHLFTVGEKEKTSWETFPIFDVTWVPTYEISKSDDYSKKYLNTLKKLAKEADSFTVACDYDIEGEVIGLNIVRHVCKAKDASRMKFSTLIKPDLQKAYEEKSGTLDWGQANAGETRHILDFFYGINLTRALTHSVKSGTGKFKLLSSGRVQGPALKIIVEREKEIRAFRPEPYWQIELNGKIKGIPITAMHEADKFWDKVKADAVMEKVSGAACGTIERAEKKEFRQPPPFPFDLTSLQLEAYRCFRIKPKETLEIAQKLYTGGYISYPRTSSQKLPTSIGYHKILEQLAKQRGYNELAGLLLKAPLKPKEGKKLDPAHPAIYPTGMAPAGIGERASKIYDLIVRRFMSVFAEDAVRETNTLLIRVNSEGFITKGTVTVYRGWHVFYGPYVKVEEKELPSVLVGDAVNVDAIQLLSKETKPPNRYTQSSIIHALEKKTLGTKATRAQIIDTLFQRGYVVGDANIEATELGIKTVETLDKYCPEILDEKLTRHFEEEMDRIRENKTTPEDVLNNSKMVLFRIIEKFRAHEKDIGLELLEANKEAIRAATEIGSCPSCGEGKLVLRKGKFGNFIACNSYPECRTTFNVPRKAVIRPSSSICPECSHPMISVKTPKRGPREMCINPDCVTKSEAFNGNPPQEPTKSKGENRLSQGGSLPGGYPEEGMECPECGEGKMVLRRSFYGQFLGCNRYPKCKTMMRIVDGKVDITPVKPREKTRAGKAAKHSGARPSGKASGNQKKPKKN